MGFYSKYLFPRLMNWTLRAKEISDLRHELLSEVKGKVLEIGFGTGLNLPHYPKSVKELAVIEPNTGMHALALKQIVNMPVKVDHRTLQGEKLPFKAGTFNSVVSTFTLCSIKDINKALKEANRVLKTNGKFFFLEHGLSSEANIKKWQNRLNPIQNIIGDGCNLNRDMEKIIKKASFKILTLKKFYFKKYPKVAGYFYFGTARKS